MGGQIRPWSQSRGGVAGHVARSSTGIIRCVPRDVIQLSSTCAICREGRYRACGRICRLPYSSDLPRSTAYVLAALQN